MSKFDFTNPWPTTYVATVPRITAGTSILSSSIILYLIFVSASRLSTVYHRIMFCMSVFDIIGSFEMFLTSLPMPRQMPREEELGISWAGVRYGNTFTCNLQGFCIYFGTSCMLGYNVMLCVYYAFAIALRFSEQNIRKYVQPILLTFPIAMGLWIAVPPLFLELYNPPTLMMCAWCYPITYPHPATCADIGGCIRGNVAAVTSDLKATLLWFVGFIIIAISIGLVLLSICFRPNPILSNFDEDGWDGEPIPDGSNAIAPLSIPSNLESINTPSFDMSRALSTTDDICMNAPPPQRRGFYKFQLEELSPSRETRAKHDDLFDRSGISDSECGSSKELKIPSKQSGSSRPENLSAVMGEQIDSDAAENESSSTNGVITDDDDEEPNLDPHPAVLVLQALTYVSVYGFFYMLMLYTGFEQQSTWLKIWLAVFPLHGFYNMIIFLSHKVYNYRRVHAETTVCEVIHLLFKTTAQEPCFVERISIVKDYHTSLNLAYKEAIRVSNEMGDRVFVRNSQLIESVVGQQDRLKKADNDNNDGPKELPPGKTSEISKSGEHFDDSGCVDVLSAGISIDESSRGFSGFSSFLDFLSIGSSKSAQTKSRKNEVVEK